MCRKAFSAAFLAILPVLITTAVNASPVIVIDDFEEWGPHLPIPPWSDISPGPSSATLTYISGDVPHGDYAGQFNFDIAGGWMYPDDPTNYESWHYAGMQRQFDPLDFQPGGEIHMHIKIEPDWDIINTDFFVIEYGGDQLGQTWLPGPGSSAILWLDMETIPAFIGPDGWSPWDGPPPIIPPPFPPPVISPDDGWVEIVIDENMWMSWGAPLVDFDAMDSITLSLWTTSDGGIMIPELVKYDGTDAVFPVAPLNGTIDIDYIYYVPEPTTIALLALGALALIRSKQSRKSS